MEFKPRLTFPAHGAEELNDVAAPVWTGRPVGNAACDTEKEGKHSVKVAPEGFMATDRLMLL